MSLNIKINNFEGPFDLLLHLIKKNEMDIYDIKIYEITNQYLQFINEMKEMDLEVTSEFIVIAATLLEIKSKLLLPNLAQDETAADSEVDPRKELIQKLVEYKKFKQVAAYLRTLEGESGLVFTKKPEIIEEKSKPADDSDILKNITMLQLYNLFNNLMNKYNSKMNKENVIQREIPVDAYKIEDKMEYLIKRITPHNHLYFSNIIRECSNKMEVVVTFLALLELIKLRNVKVIQDSNFMEIYLEGVSANE
jgi:segregation and condensation protein A